MATIVYGQDARNLGFLLSEANGERSRGKRTLVKGPSVLPPGTLLTGTAPATVGTAVDGILSYWCDPTAAAVDAPTIERDAEVNAALLIQGTMVLADIKVSLAKTGIIVRDGVLEAPGGTFATTRQTDPALAHSIYGPLGLGGIATLGGAASGASIATESVVEDGTVIVSPDGRVTPEVPVTPPPSPAEAHSLGPQQTDRPPPPAPPTPPVAR